MENKMSVFEEIIFRDIWKNLTTNYTREILLKQNLIKTIDIPQKRGEIFKQEYISWNNVWAILMKEYPDFQVEYEMFENNGKKLDVMYYSGMTASVTCTITIKGVSRSMSQGVYDYKHRAIPEPTSRDISDAKQRCFAKTAVLFGLGIFLYGTDENFLDAFEDDEETKKVIKPKIQRDTKIPSDTNFKIFDDQGLETASFSDAQSWLKAVTSNQHNLQESRKVADYVNNHPDLSEKIKQKYHIELNQKFSEFVK